MTWAVSGRNSTWPICKNIHKQKPFLTFTTFPSISARNDMSRNSTWPILKHLSSTCTEVLIYTINTLNYHDQCPDRVSEMDLQNKRQKVNHWSATSTILLRIYLETLTCLDSSLQFHWNIWSDTLYLADGDKAKYMNQ
jgi:hypothetical protein